MDDEGLIKAKNYALRLIAIRPRSEREIKDKLTIYLRKKGLPGKLIEVVVSHLKEFDFINDTDFAKWWIMQRGTSAIRGSKIITLELKSKGVSSDIITELLPNPDDNQELEKAKIVISKSLRRKYSSFSPQIVKMKLANLLFRRGFTSQVIRKAIDETIQKS